LKTFFRLKGAYEDLKVRRLKQSARIVLDQDGPPYWFVTIRNFSEHIDRPRIAAVTGSRWGNGTFRFVSLKSAEAIFERLRAVPEYAAEEIKAENSLIRRRELARAMHQAGKIGPKFLSSEKLGAEEPPLQLEEAEQPVPQPIAHSRGGGERKQLIASTK
jgi:hypothetical protein